MVVGVRLAEASGKFANGAHGPVLYLHQKQNRELPFANSVRASRIKGNVRSWYLNKSEFSDSK